MVSEPPKLEKSVFRGSFVVEVAVANAVEVPASVFRLQPIRAAVLLLGTPPPRDPRRRLEFCVCCCLGIHAAALGFAPLPRDYLAVRVFRAVASGSMLLRVPHCCLGIRAHCHLGIRVRRRLGQGAEMLTEHKEQVVNEPETLVSSSLSSTTSLDSMPSSSQPNEPLIHNQFLGLVYSRRSVPTAVPRQSQRVRHPIDRWISEAVVSGWLFFRYLVIGAYVGIATIAGFVWWFVYSDGGPKLPYSELVNFDTCLARETAYPCSVFEDHHPSTVSMTVLVVVEMFNALNNLSEDRSIM
ncbi:Sarcoplasmic/endoplasmic reticulum calcium ATPase 3 [Nymphaea thermarum]|nr:Sarcoplasmic/endoplasmic reticulum calcium ATPase 3 [Nymphaea thermarum]